MRMQLALLKKTQLIPQANETLLPLRAVVSELATTHSEQATLASRALKALSESQETTDSTAGQKAVDLKTAMTTAKRWDQSKKATERQLFRLRAQRPHTRRSRTSR